MYLTSLTCHIMTTTSRCDDALVRCDDGHCKVFVFVVLILLSLTSTTGALMAMLATVVTCSDMITCRFKTYSLGVVLVMTMFHSVTRAITSTNVDAADLDDISCHDCDLARCLA